MDALKELLLQSSPASLLAVSLLKATLVLAIAQLLVSALPRLSAAVRHMLLTAGLAAFVVIPVVTFTAPRLPVSMTAPDTAQQVATPAASSPATYPPPAAKHAPQTTGGSPSFRWTAEWLLGITWAAVALFLLARLARSAVRVRRLLAEAAEPSARIVELLSDVRSRLGRHAPVQLRQSHGVSVPMIWGIQRGTLLLPAGAEEWSDEELRATLIHELGHLQRFDYLSLTLMNLVSALFWFHPQVWSARSRALTEGERACDDLVLRAGERASEYASHLLQVARLMPRRDPLTTLLAMSRPSQLEGRMYAILSPSVNRKSPGGKLLMLTISLFAAAVIPLATMQLTIEPAMATPSRTIAVMASAIPSMDHGDRHSVKRNHSGMSISSDRNGDTGTCADYSYHFGGRQMARSEQSLTFAGNHLSVDAAENGGVSLRRSTTGGFTITACKVAGGLTDAEANQLLGRVALQERGGKVTISGPDGEGQWSAQLIVGVPDGRSIEVTTENGPLSVRGVDAKVNASVVNGPLDLENSKGEITARAKNGPLSLRGMSGNVDGAVQNGPLTVKLSDGGWIGGELRLSVQNGPLALRLPKSYPSGVQVETKGRGPFACSLDQCRTAGIDEGNPSTWQPRRVSLGSGAARVFIETGSGPVSIQ